MRKVVITREKVKLVGRLLRYKCLLNVNYDEFMQFILEGADEWKDDWVAIRRRFLLGHPTQVAGVNNGSTIEVEISEEENTLFVVALTSSGLSVSNEQIIEASGSDKSYSIKTNYDWKKGTELTLCED